MKVITKAITELTLDPNNARKHSQKNLDAIAASLEKFGQRKPIVVHRGVVIAGNGTVEAAKILGWTNISIAEVPDDWDLDTAKAYALADNRSAELAEWDESTLAKQLLELEDSGWDIASLGFETPELDVAEVKDDDEIPEPPVEPITKLGDIWVLGRHRLMCGDSTDEGTVNRLMDGAKADMVFTDPPYGMSYKNTWTAPDKFDVIENDNVTGEDLINLVTKALSLAIKSNKDCPLYVCLTWKTYTEFAKAMDIIGRKIQSCIVWDKASIGLGNTDYRPQHEFIFYSSGNWYGDRATSDIFTVTRAKTQDYSHPTQKPIELIIKCLQNSSKPKDNIVDLFGGSGSTLIAAEQTNRTCYMMELDPKYCDVIVKRWETLTGQKAELVNSK